MLQLRGWYFTSVVPLQKQRLYVKTDQQPKQELHNYCPRQSAKVLSQLKVKECKPPQKFLNTNTPSLPENSREEYFQGLRNLSNAAQYLACQPVEELMNKGLHCRKNGLRTMTAHRHYQKNWEQRMKHQKKFGKVRMVWWIRNGKPLLEEYTGQWDTKR